MKHYYHILESSHWGDSIDDYSELSTATKNFTDYSKFEDIDGEVVGMFLDPKTTRYIIDGKTYIIIKNFVNISTEEHFLILRRN